MSALNTVEMDQLLAPLAERLCHRADELLDLRQSALSRTSPGRCVKCYFKLFQSAPTELSLKPLRRWIERNIEIIASDETEKMLERMPLFLENDEEMEAFCWRFIHEFRYNRAYDATHIRLEFSYKKAA